MRSCSARRCTTGRTTASCTPVRSTVTHSGAAKQINPYVDPVWDNVSNGSGGTYAGKTVAFYGQVSNVRGMFYSGGRIYYTLTGKSDLFYRYFSPDSGIIGPDEFTASGGLSWSDVGGTFLNGSTLYYVKRSTGALWSVPFAGGAPSGSATAGEQPGDGWAQLECQGCVHRPRGPLIGVASLPGPRDAGPGKKPSWARAGNNHGGGDR